MYNAKKEMIKNTVYTIFILALAIVSTYYIYNKFHSERVVDVSSEALEVLFQESKGDRLTIDKVTPVTDSVGLSSKSYSLSIINNLTEDVPYTIKISDDLEKIVKDKCEDKLIPKDDIRISIKVNKDDNVIYTLGELEDNVLYQGQIKALEKNNISIRLWVKHDTTLSGGSRMHYHGIINVYDRDKLVLFK